MAAAVFLLQARAAPWHAALTGWAFGTGYFAHALQWIVSPFMVDVARHGWMAPFALLFLAAGLALFWGLAFWAARRISPTGVWPLVLTLPAVEMLRAYIFTGFPWALPAQAVVGQAAGQWLAWIGPYGVTLVLVALAVFVGHRRQVGLLRNLAESGVALGLLIWFLWPVDRPDAPLTDHTIRLIQPNAAQRDKWDPDQIPVFFERQLQFTAAPPTPGTAAPDLVLWSETAIPWSLDRAGSALTQIARAGGGAMVALGVQRREDPRFFNSMVVLGDSGTVVQAYDKHHLVPFGEYMPMGDLLARFGIYGLAAQAGNGYSAGPGPKLLDFGALGKALPLICYEAVFPQDVNAAPVRPDFLIQLTNDAWFGKAAGPRQHLAQARMRAIEQGLPLARSANTGISAMIDPYGRVLASLPLNAAGYVDAVLPAPLPPTLYSRTGDLPLALLLILGCAAAKASVRRRQHRFSD
jgi:apolipoprotein N-acyltransferase